MEISVKMDVAEFQEFMAWRGEKDKYKKDMERLRRAPEFMASSLRWAVEPVKGKPGKFKIVDQEHMADMWDMAQEFIGEQRKPPAPGADNTAQVAR